MRDLDMKETVDILVSELLGSFGDNELSPECLDGVQSVLKKDGISIPEKSISYLQPVMAPKVHQAIKNIEKTTGGYNSESQYCHVKVFEFNYVVYLKNFFEIDDCLPIFTFVHPNRETEIDNSRYTLITFKSTVDCMLHGFAGYFEAVLYKDIILSIHPETHTKGMASWFSMFFPIEVR
jgi:protein arginine N-methyltransferase 5